MVVLFWWFLLAPLVSSLIILAAHLFSGDSLTIFSLLTTIQVNFQTKHSLKFLVLIILFMFLKSWCWISSNIAFVVTAVEKSSSFSISSMSFKFFPQTLNFRSLFQLPFLLLPNWCYANDILGYPLSVLLRTFYYTVISSDFPVEIISDAFSFWWLFILWWH